MDDQTHVVRVVDWVAPGILARCSRPDYPAQIICRRHVDIWTDLVRQDGIRSIICILAAEQYDLYDEPLGERLIDYYARNGFKVASFVVPDHLSPPLNAEELLAVERALVKLPKPVLIHCSAGVDRTSCAVDHLQGSGLVATG